MFNRRKKNIRNNKSGASLITVTQPNHVISEQFRTIRTNIQYSMVDKSFKTLMVTSTGPNEGKTTIAANIATVMSDIGKRVLIIDGDLRRPTLHKTFKATNNLGLSSLLVDNSLDTMEVINYSQDSDVYYMSSGPIPPNPSEILASNAMSNLLKKLEGIFDLIIVDTPPILAVTDAQILADSVDGVIFVIREGVTTEQGAMKTIELLNATGVFIVGVVYNGANLSNMGSYYGYQYGPYIEK